MRRLIPRAIRRAVVRMRLSAIEFDLALAERQRRRIHADIADLIVKHDRLRREEARIAAGLA